MVAPVQAQRISEMPRTVKDLTALVPIAYRGSNYAVSIGDILSLVNKALLGLDKVDNTPDADKPLSNAVAQALIGKASSDHVHNATDIQGLLQFLEQKPVNAHTHAIVDVDGLKDALDKKISIGYQFNLSDISGLADELSGLAAKVHGHAIGDIAGLIDVLDQISQALIERPTFDEAQTLIDKSVTVVAGTIAW